MLPDMKKHLWLSGMVVWIVVGIVSVPARGADVRYRLLKEISVGAMADGITVG